MTYKDLLLSREPFQQPIPLSVSSLTYPPFFSNYWILRGKKNGMLVSAGDGKFFGWNLGPGRSLLLDGLRILDGFMNDGLIGFLNYTHSSFVSATPWIFCHIVAAASKHSSRMHSPKWLVGYLTNCCNKIWNESCICFIVQ